MQDFGTFILFQEMCNQKIIPSSIDSRDVQTENNSLSIVVTEEGISIVFNEEHL